MTTSTPSKTKAPLTVQIAAASWQSLLLGLAILAAPGMVAAGQSEGARSTAALIAGALFVLLCLFGSGCALVGFASALFDRSNRLRLFLHSLAGLVTPGVAGFFVLCVVLAGSDHSVNSRAYWSAIETLSSPRVQDAPPLEWQRVQADVVRDAAAASRGEQRQFLLELAGEMDRLEAPSRRYVTECRRREELLRDGADVVARIEADDDCIAAIEAWRSALEGAEAGLRHWNGHTERSTERARTRLVHDLISFQADHASKRLELVATSRARYDM